MFVYCNLIQPQIVGGMRSRLMQIFSLPEDETNFYHETRSMIDFIPFEMKRFENISFQLRNYLEELISFEKTIFPNHITLVFRRHEN